ncbi:hypothetical protein OUZ56_000744 [Daphnia magna]|uniref:Uncharacterized protein n=1 Tax=Daphnia magna TaxID=35525 RepID=A0ABR0A1B2_9CRUS|nr:hypothetical protein OUZ56_000744 [Daphnia magna]
MIRKYSFLRYVLMHVFGLPTSQTKTTDHLIGYFARLLARLVNRSSTANSSNWSDSATNLRYHYLLCPVPLLILCQGRPEEYSVRDANVIRNRAEAWLNLLASVLDVLVY